MIIQRFVSGTESKIIGIIPKYLPLDIRTYVYDHIAMNGNELLKKLKKLAKERQVRLELIKAHGKVAIAP